MTYSSTVDFVRGVARLWWQGLALMGQGLSAAPIDVHELMAQIWPGAQSRPVPGHGDGFDDWDIRELTGY